MVTISRKGLGLYGFISQSIKSGFSGNQTLNLLKSIGEGYNRQTFLKDFKLIGEELSRTTKYSIFGKDGRQDIRRAFKRKYDRAEKFRSKVNFTVFNTKTNQDEDMVLTIYHDTLLTQDEIDQKIIDSIIINEKTYGDNIVFKKFNDVTLYEKEIEVL